MKKIKKKNVSISLNISHNNEGNITIYDYFVLFKLENYANFCSLSLLF